MQKADYWYLVVWAIESVLTFMATAIVAHTSTKHEDFTGRG